MRNPGTSDRDEALRRLRRTTSVALASAGALVAVFAGLAAKALPGHHTVKVTQVRASATQRQAVAPPLVPVEAAAAPAAPASAPAPTQAAPVVVSGGT